MLQNSFIFLPKIALKTEQKIWQSGIHNWDDFIGSPKINGLGSSRKTHFENHLKSAKIAKREQNAKYFAKVFPKGEHWRLFNEFIDSAVCLDIETSGYYGDITVIGLSDGIETKTMVKGINMDNHLLKQELNKAKLLLTFNGSSFDLPVIRRHFDIDCTIPHIDLRFVCQKLGMSGGLKVIEKELGISRRKEVQDLSGEDAVHLWHNYRATGEREYLEKLVAYNEEDVLNLIPLAKNVIPSLWQKTRLGHN